MGDQYYLKPKAKDPKQMREKRNGQFRNPPAYNEGMGGFTSASKMPGEPSKNMKLTSVAGSVKLGKPI
jgi:hypothetical protein